MKGYLLVILVIIISLSGCYSIHGQSKKEFEENIIALLEDKYDEEFEIVETHKGGNWTTGAFWYSDVLSKKENVVFYASAGGDGYMASLFEYKVIEVFTPIFEKYYDETIIDANFSGYIPAFDQLQDIDMISGMDFYSANNPMNSKLLLRSQCIIFVDETFDISEEIEIIEELTKDLIGISGLENYAVYLGYMDKSEEATFGRYYEKNGLPYAYSYWKGMQEHRSMPLFIRIRNVDGEINDTTIDINYLVGINDK